jgi:hypothetical protein
MSTTPRFGLGAPVKHRDFGRGRVVAYDDRYVMLFRGDDAKLVAFAFDRLEPDGPVGDPELDRVPQAVRAVLGDQRMEDRQHARPPAAGALAWVPSP